MNSPAPAFVLVCPTCGKKYQGDAARPAARYVCPADQTPLVAAAPATALKSSTDTVPTAPPTQKIAPPQPHDEQVTRVLGSNAAKPSADELKTTVLRDKDADATRIMGGSLTP